MGRKSVPVPVVLLAVMLAACIPKREPLYIAPAFAEAEYAIDLITLMPVIDVRPDPFAYVRIVSQARSAGERILSGKGFTVVSEILSTPGKQYGSSELAAMSDAELATLGPEERENLLFIYVEKLEYGYGEGAAGSRVTVSAVLISRSEKQAIWRDRAVGDSSLEGLLTVLSGASTEYQAVYQALRALFSTMPSPKKT
jgi:hypothetical protein